MPEPLRSLPGPAEKRIAIHITPQAERAIRRGHPWLFDQAIVKQSRSGQAGDLAVIFDRQREFLAIGLYDPLSPIRVRVLARGKPTPINGAFFRQRLEEAARIRQVLPANTTGYRLVHGENDRLPGLVIDRYHRTLVLKLYTAAWIPHLRVLIDSLHGLATFERLVLRLSREVNQQREALHGLQDGAVILGSTLEGPVLFQENGLTFEAEPVRGHKTGFYLDQRENRSRVERLSRGKAVLNLFAYTGGFSLYAARGGARQVTSVDISSPALESARRNLACNTHIPAVAACHHRTVTQDAFRFLESQEAKARYDLVILDPPSFARNHAEVEGALRAYGQLTRLALSVLQPGGVLVQASCSSRVTAEAFFTTIHQAAHQANRPLKEMERTGHPLDHPVGFKEGAYLKCLFAEA